MSDELPDRLKSIADCMECANLFDVKVRSEIREAAAALRSQQQRWNNIPWEEIEAARYFLSRLCKSYAGSKGVSADLMRHPRHIS